MQIILADVHGKVFGKNQASANLSLLYLASYLRAHRDDVDMQYISQKYPQEFHLETIRNSNPALYAISFTSYSAKIAFALIRKIKEEFPHLPVVIGGAHVMTHGEQSLRESGADICVFGEGEQTFLEIVSRLGEIPGCLAEIEGIAFLENSRFVRNPARPLIDDLDSIPFPARDLCQQSDFVGISYSKARPNTEVIITRGCPLRCVFCANPVFRLDNGPLFRARSPENIAKEVEELYQQGYREIFFHSDELNVHLGWSIDVCKALAALGHKDLYFQANMRSVPMNEELAFWMKTAGFWLVRLGIESANIRVLRGIRKRTPLRKTEKACQLLSEQGIKVFAYFMMFNFWDHGGHLDFEKPEEIRNSISFVYRLWLRRRIHYCSWQAAIPVPGAEMYDTAVRQRFIDSSYMPDENWLPYEYLPGLTRSEYNSLLRSARWQQAILAISGGGFEWRNWRGMLLQARELIFGSPVTTSSGNDSELDKCENKCQVFMEIPTKRSL